MHKGTAYPYHWYYWATECCFWPGFVPWEMVLSLAHNTGWPWNQLNDQPPRISNEGLGVPDWTQIAWTTVWSADCVFDLGVLSCEQETIDGKNWVVWAFTIYSILFGEYTVWSFQEAPIYFINPGATGWHTAHDPLSIVDGPLLNFRPATWSEIASQPHR